MNYLNSSNETIYAAEHSIMVDTKQDREIPKLFDMLRDKLALLHLSIDEMEQRLSIVMCAKAPKEEVDGGTITLTRVGSEMRDNIDSANLAADRIIDMLKRLEL